MIYLPAAKYNSHKIQLNNTVGRKSSIFTTAATGNQSAVQAVICIFTRYYLDFISNDRISLIGLYISTLYMLTLFRYLTKEGSVFQTIGKYSLTNSRCHQSLEDLKLKHNAVPCKHFPYTSNHQIHLYQVSKEQYGTWAVNSLKYAHSQNFNTNCFTLKLQAAIWTDFMPG